MHDNLLAATHVLHAAHDTATMKLLYLASSCVYPTALRSRMSEESLMSGPLEPTSEALRPGEARRRASCARRIAGSMATISSRHRRQPFGIGTMIHPEDSHVIGALIRRLHEARVRGEPGDRLGDRPRPARVHLSRRPGGCLRVPAAATTRPPCRSNMAAAGPSRSSRELAQAVARAVGYTGELVFDPSRPDGTPIKRLGPDPASRLGWNPATDLAHGPGRGTDRSWKPLDTLTRSRP